MNAGASGSWRYLTRSGPVTTRDACFRCHQEGRRNFLYFCDIALLTTLVAVWTENSFLVSMQAVGILLPQMIWVIDMLVKIVAGVYLTGMTKYTRRRPWHPRSG